MRDERQIFQNSLGMNVSFWVFPHMHRSMSLILLLKKIIQSECGNSSKCGTLWASPDPTQAESGRAYQTKIGSELISHIQM